jgi:hypothetical protein
VVTYARPRPRPAPRDARAWLARTLDAVTPVFNPGDVVRLRRATAGFPAGSTGSVVAHLDSLPRPICIVAFESILVEVPADTLELDDAAEFSSP